MSIFESMSLPVIAVWKSRNLLELLGKNNIPLSVVREVRIGPRHLQVVSEEIARNTFLTIGEFVEVFADKGICCPGILSDS